MIKIVKKKKLNLITSLRKLFKAFSKEDTNSNNVADLVDKIADSVSENTVPKPTIEDAGKIVMIDKNGSYILNELKDSANTVLYTQQTLTTAQQAQARANIRAVSLDEIGTASIPMGHLDATSTATVMTATVEGITELRDGVCMWLRNGVITSASGFTINVNGLGAKPCYSSLADESRSTTIFNINYTLLMIYNEDRVDGGCWDIVYGVDTNTTYTTPKLGFGYAVCTTAAAIAAKTASISSYALTTGGIVAIKFDNDVPASATLNITSKGAKAIYHRGAAITAGVIKGGDTATFIYSTYYHLISIDRDEKGFDLPAVTTTDNGKFLRVINGAWAAATVPSAETASF